MSLPRNLVICRYVTVNQLTINYQFKGYYYVVQHLQVLRKNTRAGLKYDQAIKKDTANMMYHGVFKAKGALTFQQAADMDVRMAATWAELKNHLPFNHIGEAELILLKNEAYQVSNVLHVGFFKGHNSFGNDLGHFSL